MSNVGKEMHPGFIPAAVAVGLLGAMLVLSVLDLPREPAGLTRAVTTEIERTGVAHPVTAVLLNFRAYDTWLELGVLMLAVLSIFVLRRTPDLNRTGGVETPSPVLRWLVQLLVPMMILASGYLLWLGKFAAGGAFQAGVVLGVAGVLLWLADFPSADALSESVLRLLLAAGFAAFLLVAALLVLTGRSVLDFPEAASGLIILTLEAVAAVSIGLTITTLVIGLQPASQHTGLSERNSP